MVSENVGVWRRNEQKIRKKTAKIRKKKQNAFDVAERDDVKLKIN